MNTKRININRINIFLWTGCIILTSIGGFYKIVSYNTLIVLLILAELCIILINISEWLRNKNERREKP